MATDPDAILDTALALGEAASWEAVRLHRVAQSLGVPLAAIHACFPQKDDLVEAWFDRADRALLETPFDDAFAARPAPERIHAVIMRWLGALAPHRRLTRQMLAYKLEPGHLHLQVLGLLRVSRTVQWFREAARLEATGLARIAEEIGLTSIYLATFTRWLFDDSPEQRDTSALLERLLRGAEACRRRWPDAPREHTRAETARD